MKKLLSIGMLLSSSLVAAGSCDINLNISHGNQTFGPTHVEGEKRLQVYSRKKLKDILTAKGYTVTGANNARYSLSYRGGDDMCILFEGDTPNFYPSSIPSSITFLEDGEKILNQHEMESVLTLFPNGTRSYYRLLNKSLSQIDDLIPECYEN